jgi:hypothetical protein
MEETATRAMMSPAAVFNPYKSLKHNDIFCSSPRVLVGHIEIFSPRGFGC